MLAKIKTLPKFAVAVAVMVALTFGVSQALADSPCTPLPPHTCEPGVECGEFCDLNGYVGGQCLTSLHCCVCYEK